MEAQNKTRSRAGVRVLWLAAFVFVIAILLIRDTGGHGLSPGTPKKGNVSPLWATDPDLALLDGYDTGGQGQQVSISRGLDQVPVPGPKPNRHGK